MDIVGKIKRYIKSHGLLNYLRVCVQQGMTEEGRNQVIGVREDPFNVVVRHLGEENPQELIYIINPVNSYASGFFSNFESLLFYLHYAEQIGARPVVNCSTNTHYVEDDSFKGTRNYFEYFFEQPSGISVSSALNSMTVIYSEQKHITYRHSVSREVADEICVQMMRKYIRFNEETKSELMKVQEKYLMGKKVLGVKYRGTDYFINFKNHPIPCKPEQLVEKAKRLFNKGEYDAVYLATEDASAIAPFEKEFNNKLFFDDKIERGNRDIGHVQLAERSCHQHAKYDEGLNVLRDAWILANAQGICGNPCGVLSYAILFNKAWVEKPFKDVQLLDLGIRTKGIDSIRYSKNVLEREKNRKENA